MAGNRSEEWGPEANDTGPRWDPDYHDGGPDIRDYLLYISSKLAGFGSQQERFQWVVDQLRAQIDDDGGRPRCPITGVEYRYAKNAFRAPSINRIRNYDEFFDVLYYTGDNSTIAMCSLNISQHRDPTPIPDLVTNLLQGMKPQFQDGVELLPGGPFVGAFAQDMRRSLAKCIAHCISADALQSGWSFGVTANYRQTYTPVLLNAMVATYVRQEHRCAISRVVLTPAQVSIDRIDDEKGHFFHRKVDGNFVAVLGPNPLTGNLDIVTGFEQDTTNCRLIRRMLQGGAGRKFCRGWLLEIFINSPLAFGRTDPERAAAQAELDAIIADF